MSCSNCGKRKGLCPISFAFALGLTIALFVFFWSVWVMYYGVPASMAEYAKMIPANWSQAGMMTLIGFVKGFVFGLILAIIYDLIVCCCRCRGCRSSNGAASCGCCKSGTCSCNCPCCSGANKPPVTS